MTPLKLLMSACGLSQREAAAFLGLAPVSIDKMSSGKRSTPPGAIAELRGLYKRIVEAADAMLDDLDAATSEYGPPESVDLGYCADDHEAQALGFPCVGAHAAALAIVIGSIDLPVRLVPRGSTVASAAAADANDQAGKPD